MAVLKKAWDWTRTEEALTADLSEDLRDAWERLRETAAELGDQRIYASGSCIMFSRKACYFFVRPKRTALELCIFLGRKVKARQIRRAEPTPKRKTAHVVRVVHRDEVESPITDWIREAFEKSEELGARVAETRGAETRQIKTPTTMTRTRASRRDPSVQA